MLYDEFLIQLGEYFTGEPRYEDTSVILMDKNIFYKRLEMIVEMLNIKEQDLKILQQMVINSEL